jgi:two-component system LytT family sensor kinase
MSERDSSKEPLRRNFFVPFRPLVRGWIFSGLGWAAFFFALGLQIASALAANAPEVFRMLIVPWLAWSLLSPVIFRAVDRKPVESIRSPVLLLHIVSALALSFAMQAIRPPSKYHSGEKSYRSSVAKFTRPIFGPDVFIYFAIVGVAHAFSFYRRSKERELRAVELAAGLAEARLKALRMQLQPHFLFNSLNAVAALMHEDPDRAEEMIEALADFLRLTLRDSQGAETSLRKEIEFVQRYLGIEKIRFGDRLTYRIDAPDETLDARVPVLLLQPLVENSVTHGIEQKVGTGEIVIQARVENERLRLTVRDNGLGMTENPPWGVGLTNIRERLRELHGDSARFHISSTQGTTVEIEFPRRRQS